MAKFSVCRIYKVTLWLNFSYNCSVNLLQILHLYIHPLFILLVHNFVVIEGNSAIEALSSSPSAFAKHTHTTIWLDTTSSYFEMQFPSQIKGKLHVIYISYVNDSRLIPEPLSELPESSPIPFMITLGKLAKITRSKIYLFSEAIICFLLDVLHIKTKEICSSLILVPRATRLNL